MLQEHHPRNKSLKLPIWGYLFSIALIFAAYFLTTKTHLASWALILTVMGIASLQCLLQLITFLNLGLESKPKWGVLTALFTLLVIAIIFGGSLWIMKNLNYNLMPPHP